MAKFDLASYQGKIQGHLHIYSSSVPRKYLLPTIIKNFLNNYPDVSFTVGDKDSKKVIRLSLIHISSQLLCQLSYASKFVTTY